MSTASATFAPEWGTYRRTHNWVAWLLAALLGLLWLAGYGPGGAACKPGLSFSSTGSSSASVPPATTAGPGAGGSAAVAAPGAMSSATAPSVTPPTAITAVPSAVPAIAAAPATIQTMKSPAGVPAAKVYFALDKFDLPSDTDRTLAEVVAYLKGNSGAKAVISGYHDPSGRKSYNEELAQNRARAVRGALENAGIGRDRFVMQKPIETTGTGDPQEARRVEVAVQQ